MGKMVVAAGSAEGAPVVSVSFHGATLKRVAWSSERHGIVQPALGLR